VAKLAGIPDGIIKNAKRYLRELESADAVQKTMPTAQPDDQVSLTDVSGSVLAERLRSLSLDSMTPIEAMTLLYQLKKEAETTS
jgi:DNA mismatch repair protein MutS